MGIEASPVEATNTKTGQKIFFRGLDDWQKIASITIDDPNLVLCWVWFEEAFEIEKAFDIIKEEAGKHFDAEIVRVFLKKKELIINEIKTAPHANKS